MTETGRPRVVVVGAGFGGLWAVRALADAPADVLLLDRNNYHTFYPLLYQIGAAELNATEIAYPVRKILRGQENARFRMAEVEDVDLDRGAVRAAGREVPYDHLILATGSDAHFFGVEGADEHAYPLKEIEEGIALRNHVLERFEEAARADDPDTRRRLLRFVIVGGGPTGVEYAGALAELIQGPLSRDFPELDVDEVSVLLVEALDRLLAAMPEKLGRYAERRLGNMGVEVRTGVAVEEVGADRVRLSDGTVLATDTVVWTGGVRGDPDAGRWGLPTGDGGRVRVADDLTVPGHPEVQVVGDLSGFRQGGEALPMIAPAAIQQGEHAASNVRRQIEGRAPEAFRYDDPGMLAVIGRNHGVAHVFGRAFTGFAAWVLWLVIHLAKLIGFRNRLVVLLNWAWDYVSYERVVRLILPITPERGPRAGDGTRPESAE